MHYYSCAVKVLLPVKQKPLVLPKQDPCPKMPFPIRTQLERVDKRGMQGSLAFSHKLKGEQSEKYRGRRVKSKIQNWRPIGLITTDCKTSPFLQLKCL